jgi:hypothetical protein
MNKIKYEDILKDKGDLVFIISTMIPIYQMYEHHTQVLECNQWLTMLSILPLQTTYTTDAILALKCIMNDCANIYLVYGDFETGTIAMNLMNKLIKLFGENEKD